MMLDLLKPSTWFAHPHPLITKNREIFAHFDQSRPLTDYTFVVCDTELTGFDLKRDEIISIGAIVIRDLQIDLGATFHQYIRPKNTTHTQATLIHRITPQQLAEAPPPWKKCCRPLSNLRGAASWWAIALPLTWVF